MRSSEPVYLPVERTRPGQTRPGAPLPPGAAVEEDEADEADEEGEEDVADLAAAGGAGEEEGTQEVVQCSSGRRTNARAAPTLAGGFRRGGMPCRRGGLIRARAGRVLACHGSTAVDVARPPTAWRGRGVMGRGVRPKHDRVRRGVARAARRLKALHEALLIQGSTRRRHLFRACIKRWRARRLVCRHRRRRRRRRRRVVAAAAAATSVLAAAAAAVATAAAAAAALW